MSEKTTRAVFEGILGRSSEVIPGKNLIDMFPGVEQRITESIPKKITKKIPKKLPTKLCRKIIAEIHQEV